MRKADAIKYQDNDFFGRLSFFNIYIIKYRFDGHSPSGKAVEFDSTIFRRFESYMPSLMCQ